MSHTIIQPEQIECSVNGVDYCVSFFAQAGLSAEIEDGPNGISQTIDYVECEDISIIGIESCRSDEDEYRPTKAVCQEHMNVIRQHIEKYVTQHPELFGVELN